jgi:hypothetical protein
MAVAPPAASENRMVSTAHTVGLSPVSTTLLQGSHSRMTYLSTRKRRRVLVRSKNSNFWQARNNALHGALLAFEERHQLIFAVQTRWPGGQLRRRGVSKAWPLGGTLPRACLLLLTPGSQCGMFTKFAM